VAGFVNIPGFFVAESAEHSANERNVSSTLCGKG